MLQSFQPGKPCIVSASVALSSQVKGGAPFFGRPAGTCVVLAESGSPLCRWVEKLPLASIVWMRPTTYHGVPSALPTAS